MLININFKKGFVYWEGLFEKNYFVIGDEKSLRQAIYLTHLQGFAATGGRVHEKDASAFIPLENSI